MAPQQARVTLNDGVLLMSLLYSSIDIQYEWEAFSSCSRPIHTWLLVSYVVVIAFRLLPILGMQYTSTDAGEFLLNLRQKERLPQLLVLALWFVAMPFFVFWTLLGSWWLRNVMTHTPYCLPAGAHTWFIVLWQALSYMWIVIHIVLGVMAWILESRLRRAEVDLRQIADDDVIARWGANISQLPGYASLPGAGERSTGLTAAEINSLPPPEEWATCLACDQCDCSICLNDFHKGERVRVLSSCGHVFHKSCIDLWLLRNAECPLCKRDVRSGSHQA